jgi:hypothetical protein
MCRKLFFVIYIVLMMGLGGTTWAGSLVAWGWNFYGQCDVPEGNEFPAIAAGGCHNLAMIGELVLVSDVAIDIKPGGLPECDQLRFLWACSGGDFVERGL